MSLPRVVCRICNTVIAENPGPVIPGMCTSCQETNLVPEIDLSADIQRCIGTVESLLYHLQRAKFVKQYAQDEIGYAKEFVGKIVGEVDGLVEKSRST